MVADGGIGVGLAESHGGEDHCGEHCPFLNRSDPRCSDKLCLDRINHAFDYCFGDYKACPVYLEQLVERRVRRVCGLLTPPGSSGSAESDAVSQNRRPFVQLTLPPPGAHAHRYPQHAAGTPGVSAAPGL